MAIDKVDEITVVPNKPDVNFRSILNSWFAQFATFLGQFNISIGQLNQLEIDINGIKENLTNLVSNFSTTITQEITTLKNSALSLISQSQQAALGAISDASTTASTTAQNAIGNIQAQETSSAGVITTAKDSAIGSIVIKETQVKTDIDYLVSTIPSKVDADLLVLELANKLTAIENENIAIQTLIANSTNLTTVEVQDVFNSLNNTNAVASIALNLLKLQKKLIDKGAL